MLSSSASPGLAPSTPPVNIDLDVIATALLNDPPLHADTPHTQASVLQAQDLASEVEVQASALQVKTSQGQAQQDCGTQEAFQLTEMCQPAKTKETEEVLSSEHSATCNFSGLDLKHACRNCHASKTACSDVRPCNRCTRLGIDCVPSNEDNRRRSCVSCQRSKVACKRSDSSNCCVRCEAKGIKCIPRARTVPRLSGSKRKKRSEDAAADPLSLATGVQAQPAVQMPILPMPLGYDGRVPATIGYANIQQAGSSESVYKELLNILNKYPLTPATVAACLHHLNWAISLARAA